MESGVKLGNGIGPKVYLLPFHYLILVVFSRFEVDGEFISIILILGSFNTF